MKTLILYGTKHGCTEKCVGILKAKLPGDVVAVNLVKETPPLLAEFDAVVVGSSVYVGQVQKPVAAFISNHLDILQQKKLGLFLVGGRLDGMDVQMKAAFPEDLIKHAVAVEHVGFAYDFAKLNFFERKVIQVIAKIKESKEEIYQESIEKIAVALQ